MVKVEVAFDTGIAEGIRDAVASKLAGGVMVADGFVQVSSVTLIAEAEAPTGAESDPAASDGQDGQAQETTQQEPAAT
jgi:hypothetical protein